MSTDKHNTIKNGFHRFKIVFMTHKQNLKYMYTHTQNTKTKKRNTYSQ